MPARVAAGWVVATAPPVPSATLCNSGSGLPPPSAASAAVLPTVSAMVNAAAIVTDKLIKKYAHCCRYPATKSIKTINF